MSIIRKSINSLMLAGALLATAVTSASADDAGYQAALKDIEATFGSVPTFFTQMPKAGFAGSWRQLKELEFSEDTALSPKVKALIGLAVVSQIPCSYCIWADALSAKAAGASDEEIGEAVAVAATERYWSTMLNGMQVDLATFKQELGPLMAGEAE
ncbi:MAG: carboxymuconolactone decarboxylase family protein [Bauldia sp.]|uniref:carboxymuconolactone decarboxylase family protein n=1 Tax=Bauldia sp. TaxID=2575872 RepID=UPI001D4AC540|nr:carboxymuconolactone decarboxylase family protein [Bauldia sp.]MCB1494372.1 carboxymuconolactone decarboxylase family protein [Bauldia sp.]